MKSGFISIIGKPNVGKSTLINALLGEKIAITSPKPQTTRHRITGVLNNPDYQMIFVDTPGMHEGKHLLGKTIDKVAVGSMQDVDVILLVVDRKYHAVDEPIIKRLLSQNSKVILVINKIDALSTKTLIDDIIISFLKVYPFSEVIPISAQNKIHLDQLKTAILTYLPEGPQYFPTDYVSDQSETKLASEIVRERILHHAEQEVPHAVTVIIESMNENLETKTLDVSALIIVERPTQKQILIGKNGEKLKQIGKEARLEINHLLNRKIHLSLWIKVKKDWRNNPNEIKRYGYGD